MSATVSGVFRIIDRASGPMKNMEMQAAKTDLAIQSVGDRLDDVGTRKQLSSLRDANDEFDRMDDTTEKLGGSNGGLRRTSKGFDDIDRSGKRMNTTLTRAGVKLASLGKIFQTLKIPAVIAAIGQLTVGVSALTAGVVALIPQLVQWAGSLVSLIPNLGRLGGLAAAAIPAVVGLAGAFGGARLAFMGFGAAVTEGGEALAKLEPQARRVAQVLRTVGKDFGQNMQAAAQRSFFGQFNASQMRKVLSQQNRSIMRGIVETGATTAGMAATQASNALVRPGVLSQIQTILSSMQTPTLLLTGAFTNLVKAVLDLGEAAIPMTRWLGHTVAMWADYAQETMRAAKESGRLTRMFKTVRVVTEQFGRILKDVWGILGDVLSASDRAGQSLWDAAERGTAAWEKWTSSFDGRNRMQAWFDHARESASKVWTVLKNVGSMMVSLGAASRQLGDSLWNNIERVSGNWAEWMQSLEGQNAMQTWFAQSREPLRQMGLLVGDLAKAFVEVSKSGGFVETIATLRKGVEPLAHLFKVFAENTGPAFADTLVQVVRLMSSLSETGNPFFALLETMNALLDVVNDIIETIPGMKVLLTVVLGTIALRKVAIGLGAIAMGWRGITTAALEAAGAQRAAMASAMTGGRYGGRAGQSSPGTGTAAPILMGGQRSPGTGSRLQSGAAALGAGAGAAGGMIMGGAAGMAEFLWPLMMMMGFAGAASNNGNIWDRIQAGNSAATFGILPGPKDPSQDSSQGAAQAQFIGNRIIRQTGANRQGNVGGLNRALRRTRRALNRTFGAEGEAGRQFDMHGVTGLSGLAVGAGNFIFGSTEDGLSDAERKARAAAQRRQIRQLRQTRNSASLQLAQSAQDDIMGAFNVYSRKAGPVKAAEELRKAVLEEIGPKLGREGSKAIANTNLRMLQQMSKDNPKVKKIYDDLRDGVERNFKGMGENVRAVNGRIYTGSQSEWKRIRTALSTQTEKARQDVTDGFTAMQKQALQSLITMGYSRQEATSLLRNSDGAGGPAAGSNISSGMGNSARNAQHRGGGGRNATGGRVGSYNRFYGGGRVPGLGSSDHVKVGPNDLAAPGELIVNQHTEADVNRDLMHAGKPPLGARVASESRPHYLPATHARGGRTQGLAPSTHPELNPALQRLEARLAAMGFVAGSTTGGTHAPGSFHYSGSAIDYGDATNNMQRLWSVLRPSAGSFAELFGPSAMKPGPTLMHNGVGFSDPGLQADHEDHIHVGLVAGGRLGRLGARGNGGMLGGAAVPGIAIKIPRSGVGGAPGGVANRALQVFGKGLEQKVNQRIGATGGGGGPIGAKLRAFQSINRVFAEHNSANGDWGGRTLPFNTIASLAEAAGDSLGINVPGVTMAEMTKGESGMRPGATGIDPGGTKGLGLWMITTGFNDALIAKYGGEQQMLNPVKNALAMAEIYGSQGLGAWYGDDFVTDANAHWSGGGSKRRRALGGRLPEWGGWFGSGGSFDTSGPMMIGVGESGSERVTVTPTSKKKAGRGEHGAPAGVTIGAIHINNHREGDIKRQIKKEVSEAFGELSDELEGDGSEGMV